MTKGQRNVSREKDDLVIRWLRLRHQGFAPSEIARRFGVASTDVGNSTDRVHRADIEECGFWGDDPGKIAKCYWPRMRAPRRRTA